MCWTEVMYDCQTRNDVVHFVYIGRTNPIKELRYSGALVVEPQHVADLVCKTH